MNILNQLVGITFLHITLKSIQITLFKNFIPVKGQLIFPSEYLSAVVSLCVEDARGLETHMEYIDNTRIRIEYIFPLAEILTKFFDTLKSVTSGYGSFDYEDAGYRTAPLGKS